MLRRRKALGVEAELASRFHSAKSTPRHSPSIGPRDIAARVGAHRTWIRRRSACRGTCVLCLDQNTRPAFMDQSHLVRSCATAFCASTASVLFGCGPLVARDLGPAYGSLAVPRRRRTATEGSMNSCHTTGVADGLRRRGNSMSIVTRRGFMAFAGLAAAVLSRAAAAQQTQATSGQDRSAAPRATSRARDLTDAELEAMFQRCSNAGQVGRGRRARHAELHHARETDRRGAAGEDRRSRFDRPRHLDDGEQGRSAPRAPDDHVRQRPRHQRLLHDGAARHDDHALGRARALLVQRHAVQRAQALGHDDGRRRSVGIDLRACGKASSRAACCSTSRPRAACPGTSRTST